MFSFCAFLLALSLLINTTFTQIIPSAQKQGFSVSARRGYDLEVVRRRDGASTQTTKDVITDFTFGGQRIPVAIDTGGTFTLVASTLGGMDSETTIPTFYNPNASSTYHDEHDPSDDFDCTLDARECFLGVEDISTGGLTAEQMTFGVGSYINQGFFQTGQAATMGFGRQSGDPETWLPRDHTFWYRVGADLPMPYLFTVDIYNNHNGSFDFGFIDEKKYRGDITFVDMDTSRDQWNFNLTGFAVGQDSMHDVKEFTGLVDTGGPNIGLPAQIVAAYFSSFGGKSSSNNGYTYPCSAYPPPNLTLRLASGGTLVLDGAYLVTPPDSDNTVTCNGRIDDSEQVMYNFGACMLDQKFVIFDNAGKRIGFADKASFPPLQSSAPMSSTTRGSSTATSTITSTSQPTSSSSGNRSTSVTTASPSSSTSNAATVHFDDRSSLLNSCIALIAALVI